MLACDPRQFAGNLCQLRTACPVLFHLRLYFQYRIARIIQYLDTAILLHDDFVLRLILRTAPGRLSERKQLIISHLQIKAPRLPQLRRLRPLQHLHTVRPVLHL